MATAPSPNDLTRQQLDELDALLQKMLTVPLVVDTPPPAATLPPMAQPPLPPSWRIDPPSTARATSLADFSLDDLPAPPKFEAPAPPPAPKAVKPVPSPPPVPAPKPVPPAPKVTPAPLPASKPVAVVAPPRPQATPTPAALTPAPLAPSVPLPVLPFVALNGLFDGICGMFGPPGRLFRSGFFKHLYGLAGLGLMAYTALHIAQVQGWLTLPVVLPWPK